ncbi:MAG: PPC domain-containing protein [Planctomycetota bacterium]
MRSALSLGLLMVLSQILLAQAPRIAVVQPAGAKAGGTVQLTIAGQDLEGVEGLHFSFPGVKAELQGTETVVEAPAKKGQKKAATAPSATLRVKVTLPPNSPVGLHDVRLVGKLGVSNPRPFIVGELEELSETEPNDDVPQANKIPLNVTVNGVISAPTDVDFFQFSGKKGQRVVASCLTTSIESKLQATAEIFTLAGRPLASNRNYQNNDAVVDATLPEDGDYLIRLSSFTHTQGGVDYNYRLTVGTMPWIDAVVPAAVEPGKETKVLVLGRNLPGGVLDPKLLLDGRPLERATVTVKAPGDAAAQQRLDSATLTLPARSSLDGFDLRLTNPSGSSNPYFLAFAKSPVAVEVEPNDRPDMATPLTVPVQVSGWVDRRDVDWFRFSAKKDVPLAIELFADRLNPTLFGSAVDLKFVVLGPDGNVVTTQDENPEIMANHFFARHEDPARYRLAPTADGEYRVGVSATDDLSGPRSVYSLRIAPEDGDFRVVATALSPLGPDAAVVGTQGRYAFNLFVWRLGDFAGDITVQGKKLPPGVSVTPQVISSNQKTAAVVVSVAADAPQFTGAIELEAVALVDGKKQTRDVRAAGIAYPVSLITQPTVGRLDRELIFAIRDKAKYSLTPTKDRLAFRQGEKVNLALKLQALNPEFKGTVQVFGVGLPTGMVLPPTTLTIDKETPLTFDSKTPIAPGNYTVVLRGQTQPATGKPPVKGAPTNFIEHATPVALTIVPKQVLELTPPAEAVALTRGKDAEAKVKIAKLFAFDGPVEATLVPGTKGVTLTPLKSKGDEGEVKLVFRAGDDAPAGMIPIVVRWTARIHDLEVTNDMKMNVLVK